jgi:uncharacterized membrane protein YfcA
VTLGALALLAGAGFLAGTVNAVAGGGSLISFPALLAVGYPAVPANVTNTVALWPGYVGGALGYTGLLRRRLHELLPLAVTSLVGAVLGALLLLTTSADVFRALVPYLILASCLLLAVQPTVARIVRGLPGAPEDGHRPVALHACVLAASVYGSYFGAGLGVMLLAVLGVLLRDGLGELNGIKNALSLLINTVALVAFALFGPVEWAAVLVMAVASLVGGYCGALVARRIAPGVLRASVLVFGVVVAGWLLVHG